MFVCFLFGALVHGGWCYGTQCYALASLRGIPDLDGLVSMGLNLAGLASPPPPGLLSLLLFSMPSGAGSAPCNSSTCSAGLVLGWVVVQIV